MVSGHNDALDVVAAAATSALPLQLLRPPLLLLLLLLLLLGTLWQAATATLYNALRCVLHSGCASQGRVVSGHNDALDVVAAAAGQLGALKVARLAVSGAFHTPLMEPARETLMQVLSAVEIRAPRIPVLSNVTAGPFPSDPAAIRELLGRQLVEPVRYEGCFACVLLGGGLKGGLCPTCSGAVQCDCRPIQFRPCSHSGAAGQAAGGTCQVGFQEETVAMFGASRSLSFQCIFAHAVWLCWCAACQLG